MDRLTSMAVFVCVAEQHSFSAAARAFDLSATMVSNHVRTLETQLGARLIERTTRRQRLTDIGRAYLDACREVLASVQSADQVVEALRAMPQGRLRVSAPVTWGTHRLMPVIGDYLAAHPQVTVDLHLNDRVIDLIDEGFDCALRSGPLHDDRLVARTLARSRMRVAASPAYLARHSRPRRPADLAKHTLLAFEAWGPNHHWRFSRQGEVVEVPVRGPLTTNSGQALLSAALAGMGVIVQADALLDEPIDRGALVELLPQWQLPTREIHLVRLPDARPSAKLRSFVDFVVERLGPTV